MKYLLFFFLFFSSICFAQNLVPQINELGDGWFEVTSSVVIENITPQEAKKLAIQKACQTAIEQFSGIEVTGRTSLIEVESGCEVTIDHFSKLTNQTSQGVILKKEILKEENITQNNILYKSVTVKVKVGKQEGERDPFFKLEATLNKDYFKEGDVLELEIIPSKDCYLTILNIMSDENVITIFPNKYRKDNFVKANQVFKLPDEKDKSLGIKFKVGLLPGKEEDTEIVKILATKEPVNLQIGSDYKTALESLQNWLVTIPRSHIEEVDLQYYIYK
ncbi:MAG: DUF4384 domain-containing protein [Candidatus Cloacimonetes bacterium]|nr:DUF4384 domain-containing protein [Candidatus Cloacimonadota bacterium]